MTQRRFVEGQESSWRELDGLIARVGRRGLRSLDARDVQGLGERYRAATSDLAYAQGRHYDPRLLAYLNRLVARAHAIVYGADTQTGSARIARFYSQTFPQEFRRSFVPFAICALLTIVAAVVAYAVIGTHPGDAYALLPKGMIPPPIHKSLHDSNFNFDTGNSPLAASQIITNNIRVSIMAFAGCVTLGALTVYIIITNGLMLGGLGAAFTNAGFGYDFWATIAPHGAIELTAIQIAGAAGLLIAAGVVAPGRLRRRDAIRTNAARAGVLFAGVASMLVVAGTIEGFFSPLRLAANVRLGFGCVTVILLVGYFTLAGRRERPELP